MSVQYLLPCACGQKVRVETAQAGESVACVCGQPLTVPTFRGLKQLEVAPPEAANSTRRGGPRRWSKLQGAMFSLGLLAALGGLVAILFTFFQYLVIVDYTIDQTPVVQEFVAAHTDEMTLTDSLDNFIDMRDTGMGAKQEPHWIQAKRIAVEQWSRIRWLGGLMVVGLVAAVASLLMRGKPAA